MHCILITKLIHCSMHEVVGRCTVDIRVCASPGRDREVDEKKVKGESTAGPPSGPDNPDPPTRRGRKRGTYIHTSEIPGSSYMYMCIFAQWRCLVWYLVKVATYTCMHDDLYPMGTSASLACL